MARRPNPIPTYRLHKQSGQAIVTLRYQAGNRRDVLLGAYDTPESRAQYRRVLAEWEAAASAGKVRGAAITVNELALPFLRHADQHYRHADGRATGEADEFRLSIRPLAHLFGHTVAVDFGPLRLKAVRDAMMIGYMYDQRGPQRPLARRVIDQGIGRIRRIFRWAVREELIPSGTIKDGNVVGQRHFLQWAPGGRTAAREGLAPDSFHFTCDFCTHAHTDPRRTTAPKYSSIMTAHARRRAVRRCINTRNQRVARLGERQEQIYQVGRMVKPLDALRIGYNDVNLLASPPVAQMMA